MRCVADPDGNMRRPSRACARRPRAARRSSACRSCSAASTSARPRTTLLRPGRADSRARPPRRSAALAAELGVVIVASLFEKRAEGLYHNTAAILDADGQLSRHVPEDAHPGRSAVLREVLLHAGRPRLPQLGHPVRPDRRAGLLGPVVSRGRPAHGPDAAPRSCSIPPPSAGSRRRRRSTARSSRRPGKRSSAATPSPTACTSCAVNRVGHEGDADGRHRVLGRQLRRRSRRAHPRRRAAPARRS